MTFWLPIGDDANELLRRNPLALLIGMTLDQQVPMERAFSAPYDLVRRLGHEPDPHELATYDPDALIELFARRPALHRFPKAMAGRVQKVCQTLVERHDGDAAALWNGATDGRELLKRVSELPGFGRQKAQIFVALLGKQFGVRPPGWREAVGDYGQAQAYRSVADVIDEASLGRVREHKKRMKAEARSATGT